jgi:hypothetical protein
MIVVVQVHHALPEGKISPVVARFKFPFEGAEPTDDGIRPMLETAFERTNTIDEPWWTRDCAKGAARQGCRSTSVGDMMLVRFKNTIRQYIVAPAGFERCS